MNEAQRARVFEPGFVYKRSDSGHHIKDRFDAIRAEIAAKQAQTTTVRVMRKKGTP